jgi:hypothetical protein
MGRIFLLIVIFFVSTIHAQELYVFTDPASNIPARSINVKLKTHGVGDDKRYGRFTYRVMPQITAGLSKKIQLRLTTTAANMHTNSFDGESVGLGVKYAFHFYDEISLMGDKTGVELGLIATQLWHKFALSGTLSRTEVLDPTRYDGIAYFPKRQYRSLNYAVSAGYLLFPREYRDYKQPNFNLYVELLGQRLLGDDLFYLDLAPAVQLILNSTTKINVGQRYQLQGNMGRMARRSWLVSVETSFLQAWR